MVTKKKTTTRTKATAGKGAAKKSATKGPTSTATAKKRAATKPRAAARPAGAGGTAPKPKRKTTRHVNAWRALSTPAREQYFEDTPPGAIVDAIEASYAGDVVNMLMDMRKSTVRQLLERLAGTRKRAIGEVVTLYYYNEYLMNPLPMQVGNNDLPNYYAILGIPREADAEDIKLAHRLLSRAHRPDVFSPDMREAAEVRLSQITDAFQHLKTDERRLAANSALPTMQYLYPRRDQSWLEAAQRVLESRS